MNWTDLSSAPAPGTRVAGVSTLSGAQAITVTTDAGEFPLLVVVTDDGIKGYVNACPHQFLPLDYRSPRLLSQDGTRLMCSAHGAMFDAATGQGVAGEGLGCRLSPVPLRQNDGQILIGGTV
ncbi:MAG: Rieske 2Fe-2S domain-containing protein [Paracoccus sp. (in: a-proteobacteria)]|nr:Rieske 2Fe-2S domain-containing protein [Paracoccus sp. (in: a-proteobacteria)]